MKYIFAKGPSSKKYHLKPECRGLSNCSTKTYKVELPKEKKWGEACAAWKIKDTIIYEKNLRFLKHKL